jgi:hypothetical protein
MHTIRSLVTLTTDYIEIKSNTLDCYVRIINFFSAASALTPQMKQSELIIKTNCHKTYISIRVNVIFDGLNSQLVHKFLQQSQIRNFTEPHLAVVALFTRTGDGHIRRV